MLPRGSQQITIRKEIICHITNEGNDGHKEDKGILRFPELFLLELWKFRILLPLRTAKLKTVSGARLALR
jgi:hypothetical protein